MDQAWRAAVNQAISPTVLMECVILLEHYINKTWLQVGVCKHRRRYDMLFVLPRGRRDGGCGREVERDSRTLPI